MIRKYALFIILSFSLCLCISGCSGDNGDSFKKSKLYSYMDKMKEDTYLEKRNNPESCYQVANGYVYWLDGGNLYRITPKDMKAEKIITDVRSFLITPQCIFYCTEGSIMGNSLRRCAFDGEDDEILHLNVDVCTLDENEERLLLSGHIENWTIGEYQLKNKQFKEIEVDSSLSYEQACFCDGKFIYADTYDISSVDVKTGKAEELWSMYDEVEALARTTCIYVHENKIYYGIKGVKEKSKSITGLWMMDLDGKNNQQLNNQEVNKICFVGDELVILE